MRFVLAPLLAGALLTTMSARAESQSDRQLSRAAGPFFGGSIESASIVVFEGEDNVEESGGGAGFVFGYGFSPHWSLYTQVNASSMQVAGGTGEYSLVHFDLGTRIHFRAGAHRVVPFMQVALTGRTTTDDVDGTTATTTGGGISLGTGLNVHVKPSLAVSGALSWTLGTFDEFTVGDRTIEGTGIVAGTTRVQLGLTWFPRR
jgi:hypothetical protein